MNQLSAGGLSGSGKTVLCSSLVEKDGTSPTQRQSIHDAAGNITSLKEI